MNTIPKNSLSTISALNFHHRRCCYIYFAGRPTMKRMESDTVKANMTNGSL